MQVKPTEIVSWKEMGLIVGSREAGLLFGTFLVSLDMAPYAIVIRWIQKSQTLS